MKVADPGGGLFPVGKVAAVAQAQAVVQVSDGQPNFSGWASRGGSVEPRHGQRGGRKHAAIDLCLIAHAATVAVGIVAGCAVFAEQPNIFSIVQATGHHLAGECGLQPI